MKTTATTEAVSSRGVEMRVEGCKSQRSDPRAREKLRGGLENTLANHRLANLWCRKKVNRVTKKTHIGRGHKSKLEIPD
jgi:hypothetical protein